MPTNRVPLVCTPEEFVKAVRWAANFSMTDEGAARTPAVAALFRPAEEPEPCDHEWIRTMTYTPEWCRKCLVPKEDAPAEPPWDDGLTATERERLLRRATMEVDLGGLPLRQPIETLLAAPPPAGEPSALTHDRESLRQAWNDAENENERLSAEVAALRAENERLKEAIRWALGEGDSDFGDMMPPMGKAPPYWWRTHLRRKAGLVPPGENRSEG